MLEPIADVIARINTGDYTPGDVFIAGYSYGYTGRGAIESLLSDADYQYARSRGRSDALAWLRV